MKKNVLKEVPTLKSGNGTLTGGFSTLSIEQKRKLKGGRLYSNTDCTNELDCTQGSHERCSNLGKCYSTGGY
ncbi:MAG: hypothetical protein LBE36_08155 [Flavobacteriaceae bacterium]|jgi:hypothetical protein|nr:hypothetical protein [Flavobacteriaceae bacterium]